MAHLEIDAGTTARKRVASRLLPFLFLLYVANILDRTNIAFATLGMKGQLGLNDSVFGTASGIFFLGYLVLQIPGALLVERWSARWTLTLTLLTWGALTSLTGLVRTPIELYGARFLLGTAEAAFFPGIIVYLSHWFVRQDRAKAVSRFMSAAPLAYILGGPLAGWILRVDWLGLPGWRWLFLLEGIPAIVLGIVTAFYLPDRPNEVGWLSASERTWLTGRLAMEQETESKSEAITVGRAMRHPAVLILTIGLFFCYTGGYAFWFWFPTMLQRMTGWTDVQKIGLVGAIPFLVGLVGMWLLAWSSDRRQERRWHFAIPQLVAAAALIAWFFLPPSTCTLLVVFSLVGFGTTAYLPSFWALPSSILPGAASAAAVGFISCVASIGGFVGPKIMGTLSQRNGGSFASGFLFMIVCWTVGAIVVLACPRGQSKCG